MVVANHGRFVAPAFQKLVSVISVTRACLKSFAAILRPHGVSDWGSISLLGSWTGRAELNPTYNTPTLPSGSHCCVVQHRFEVQPRNNITLCW